MTADLARHIGEIARAILGEPNKTLSTRKQLRFGNNGSIAVDVLGPEIGSWYDHENQQGGGPWDLIRVFERKVDGEAVAWLKTIGIDIEAKPGSKRILATYDYRDENGKLLFQVVRFDPKDFRQRKPDGIGGWNWRTNGVRMVPYRLPELIAAAPESRIFVVEGEKDADNLVRLGLVATCNPGGAAKPNEDGRPAKAKWPASFGVFFKERHVVIIPDNDQSGQSHAEAIARNVAPLAASTKILDLADDYPNLPPKGDVSDWIAAGGTKERLERLSEVAAPFLPRDKQPPAPIITDDSLALQFTEAYASQLRYVASWGDWMWWADSHWKHEETLRAFDLARRVCRDISAQINDPRAAKLAAAIASAKTVAAVERLAKADRRHAMTTDQWDDNDRIFNPPPKEFD